MADPFSVNKQTQIGVESTSGTAVPANKLLTSLDISLDPSFNILEYKGTGRRFDSIVVPAGDESVSGKVSGGMTFTEFVYLASMCWGAATITTPTNGVNSRQWQWKVPLSGRVNPKSMTIEQGDSDDAERVAYAIMSDLGFEISRSSSQVSGSLLAQAIEKANAGSWTGMTASPTKLALVPIVPTQWSAYLDDAPQAGGTTTKLSRCFKAKFDYGGAFGAYYAMDASQTSFAGIADGADVKAMLTLTLMKDAVGEALWKTIRAGGVLKYIRLLANGDAAENFKTVSVTGSPTGGTFTLVYGGVTSGPIQSNSTASQLQTVLDAMTSLGAGTTVCSGGPLGTAPIRVDMEGSLINDPISNVFTLGTNSLTGGTSPAPAFTTPVLIPSSMQLDVAVRPSKPGSTDDTQGTRTRDWDFTIVESSDFDGGVGGAITLTMVNNLTAL